MNLHSLTLMSCCSLFCRCYNYWFWVPVVAPLVGGVFGSLMYLIFIDWQLPDPDQLERISTISEKLAKKQPVTTLEKGDELNAVHF